MNRHLSELLAAALLVVATDWSQTSRAETPEPVPPLVAEASDEGQIALQGFRIPSELRGTLFAAEPLVANPVAFTIDHQGRVLVCESFRQNKGVTDNRGHDERWLERDLAARTVEDRLQYHRELLPDQGREYMLQDDRIRLLEDTDGDGRADRQQVFADRFNQLLDGTGAGVLRVGDSVYYTCIPHLWKLEDRDGDGRAEQRESLHRGFGVRVAFRGHDLHGLIQGPDGRLYFSIGDRGYHIPTSQGLLADPESGAVFRCELDGSGLEVVATGLRNPQELAFDQWGNLFTGDNNSDSGDRARWVYVVPGSDSGWRMAYQYLQDRGPFNRERLWHPYHEGQAAYIVPPVANLADGPSGLAYYPGTGLTEEFQGRFLLCDFRGGPGNSGIRTFRVQPQGAFFEVVDSDQPFWNILATDVAFGPDGALYVSDWVNGWNGDGKGRIYRFALAAGPSEGSREVQQLLNSGLASQTATQLRILLGHPDQRIRQLAQFELAERDEVGELVGAARHADSLLARLHAVWGLGQMIRSAGPGSEQARETLIGLLGDSEAEIRGQAAWTYADSHRAGSQRAESDQAGSGQAGSGQAGSGQAGSGLDKDAAAELRMLLGDPQPRVRYFASQAVGRLGLLDALPQLLEILEQNSNADPILRHGAIMGLVGLNPPDLVSRTVHHRSPAVRLAAVVALRKLGRPEAAGFLQDPEPQVVLEAARAIHDLPLPAALPDLAALIDRPTDSDPLLRRVLNANFRLGTAENAKRLANFAARGDAPPAMRLEALRMLADWKQPSARDRVLGMWRPLDERPLEPVATAVRQALPGILSGPDEVRQEGASLAAGLGIEQVGPTLRVTVLDQQAPASTRAAALLALNSLKDASLMSLVESSLDSNSPRLRVAALEILARNRPSDALVRLNAAADSSQTFERQQAYRILASLELPDADQRIARSLEDLLADRIPADTQLDVLQAADRRKANARIGQLLARLETQRDAADPLSLYLACLEGGDAERGRRIFHERTQVSCLRCHKVDGRGGAVGPDLNQSVSGKTRRYLLEAIVLPNATIAKGFETTMVATDDGKVHVGLVQEDSAQELRLLTAEGQLLTLPQESIEARRPGQSAMPNDLVKQLSREDLRDLVEFLSGLQPLSETAAEQ